MISFAIIIDDDDDDNSRKRESTTHSQSSDNAQYTITRTNGLKIRGLCRYYTAGAEKEILGSSGSDSLSCRQVGWVFAGCLDWTIGSVIERVYSDRWKGVTLSGCK